MWVKIVLKNVENLKKCWKMWKNVENLEKCRKFGKKVENLKKMSKWKKIEKNIEMKKIWKNVVFTFFQKFEKCENICKKILKYRKNTSTNRKFGTPIGRSIFSTNQSLKFKEIYVFENSAFLFLITNFFSLFSSKTNQNIFS